MQRSASHTRVQVPRNGAVGMVGPVSGLKGVQGLGMGDKSLSLPSLFPGYPPASGEQQSLRRTPSQLLLERQEFGVLQAHNFGSKPKITGFLDLAQFSNHTTSSVPVDQTLFSVFPPVVSFVDFEGLQTYETTITLRNQDSVARRVKVCPPDSPFFEVAPLKSPARLRAQKGGATTGNSSGDKVAPGMELSYIVRFRPDARIDYSYDLVVVTEREKFSVPIRASGGSALLDFPDVVDFGDECVVGHKCERTVLVRNVGDRATKLLCRTSPPFSIQVPDGYLEEGAACEVSIFFTPTCAERLECDLYLKYGELEAVSTLRGAACNANVSLSHSLLMVDDTYVGLESQGVVTIRNDSDVPVDFSWRLFRSESEEVDHRLELQRQLKEEEMDEMLYMQQGGHSEDSDDSCSDNERLRARRESKVTKLLGRKYDNIIKATREDPMLFRDAIFSIQPLNGRLWPHTQITCACCFLPKDALIYSATAYLSAVGQEERAPLEIKGLGIGPKATFSYDELDVGNVFVESAHRYEVQLLNQGDIEVEFRLIKKDTKFAPRFKFTPDHGIIAVGGQCEIIVDFKPKELGLFHEVFEWALKGSATAVTLAFRGNSVRPKFDFDIDKINFGTVSFGFLNSRMLTLTNTSEVPCYYTLKVPGDEVAPNNEFVVIPSGGTLLPSCAQRIQVDFVSRQEKKYDAKLSVDLEGVGKELLSIPIIAQCAVPTVSFEPHGTLNYGDVFIRYPFHQSLYLHNTSVLPAKFEVEPQEDKSRAEFEPDQWVGTVPPCASHVITVTLTAHTPGPLRLPMYVKIHGREVPFPLVLVGNSVGPRVVVDPPSLDWSTVQCLEPITKHVRLTNNSCIDASVRAFMNDRKSLWSVHPKVIHLSPQETLQLALTLKIDETATSVDYLNLIVNEGEDLTVQVRGKGAGTPVKCALEEGIDSLDFETLFTTHTESKEIIINNWGRAYRRLTWSKDKEKEKKKEKERKEREAQEAQSGKKKKKQEDPDDLPPVFRVEPESVMLEPKSAFRFTFMAVSPTPGFVEDELICTETLDKGGGAGKQIFRTQLKATFVAPQLRLSCNKIEFEFLWDKNKPIASMSESFTLENTGPLEVRFTVQVVYPFSTDIEEGAVPPNGTQDVVVDFDPGYKVDRKSGTIRQRMIIQYDDHPATNTVELIGKVVWPNLELDTNKLDFGTVLNNTSRKLEVKMTNPTVLSVAYRWAFSLPGSRQGDEASNPRTPAASASLLTGNTNSGFPSRSTANSFGGPSSGVGFVDSDVAGSPSPTASGWGSFGVSPGNTARGEDQVELNEVFDILPIFGRIEPGETHTAIFTYDGMRDRSFKALAVCMVDGGPEYEVSLRGTAAPCRYALDRNDLDFGDVPFTEVVEGEVYLSNRGQVPANFNFNLSGVSRPYVVDIVPSSGVLKPEERLKVNVRFRAGIPDQVVETVLVEVAHFEPATLTVRGQGTFPGIVIGLKRMNEEEHHIQLAAAMQRVQQRAIADADASSSAADDKGHAPEADKLPTRPTSPSASTRHDSSFSGGTFHRDRSRGKSIVGDDERDFLSPRSVATGTEAGRGSLKDTVSIAARLARLNADPENPDRELELEVDRHTLCEVLLNGPAKGNTPPSSAAGHATAGVSRTSSMSPSSRRKVKDSNDPPSVTAAHYVCDFGYIALGQEGKKEISVFNCCQEAVAIGIDKKNLKEQGFLVVPEKDLKLAPDPNKRNILQVTATRAREDGEASIDYAWNLPVRGGPNYIIQLTANFVLPDLVLSTESIDFGRLIVGQRKRVIIEFQNTKSVPVDWAYLEPKDKFGKKPDQAVFDLNPSSGTLQPGDRKLLTASFTPTAPGTISGNLSIRMRDNHKRKTISVTGRGEILRLDVRPSYSYQLGPIMPSNGGTSQEFWLMNPTDYPIEVYSTDFDAFYSEEERALTDYDGYASGIAEVPLRQPGDGIWKKVARRVLEIRKARMEDAKAAKEAAAEQARLDEEARKAAAAENGEELEPPSEEALAEAAAAEERDRLEEERERAAIAKLEEAAVDSEEEEEMDASAYPYRVPTEKRVNAILIGPPKSGVSSFAKKLSKDPEDKRRILKIDDVINWVKEAQKFLHDDWTARKAGERLKDGRSPTTSEVAHILQRRSELVDCNAGIILDGLESEHLNHEQVTEAFIEAFSKEKVVFIAVQLPEPEVTEEEESPEEDPPPPAESEPVDESAEPPVLKPPPPSLAGEALAAHYETLQSALVTYAEELKAAIPVLEAAKKSAEDTAVTTATKAEAATAAAAAAVEEAEAVAAATQAGQGAVGVAAPAAAAATATAPSAGDAAAATEGEVASEEEPDLESLKVQALAADASAKKALAEAIAALEDAKAELACCEASVGWKPPEVEIDPALAELLAPPPAADPKAKAKAKAKAAAEPPPEEEPAADPAIEELVKVYNEQRAAALGVLERYNEKTRLEEEERQRDQERARRRKKAAAMAAKDAQRSRLNSKNAAPVEPLDITASDFMPKMEGWSPPTEIFAIPLAGPPFEGETVRSMLPLPLIPLEAPLPLPKVTRILTVPLERPERNPPANFSILTPQPAVSQPIGKASSRLPSKEQTEADGEGEEGEEKPEPEKETLVSDVARWIIEPQCEQRLLVHFDSEQVAPYSTTLRFEVLGDVANGPASISVSGVAALPGINSDPRLIFPRRKKKRPEDGYAVKAFVTSLGVYDFGPLLAGRDPSSRNPAPPPAEEVDELAGASGSLGGPTGGSAAGGDEAGEGLEGASQELQDTPEPREKTAISSYVMRHAETIRIQNDSLFPASVQLGLSSSGGDFAMGEEGAKDSPFIVEPESLRLEIGETAEVKVWCFPPDKGVYQDTLVARIEHNPEPVAFNLCALGAVPVISIDKQEVDFGRLMMNIRADDQRVRVKNEAAVPVRWQLTCVDSKVVEADPDPDKEPPEEGAPPQLPDEFGVEPKEGLLAAGEERDVRFSFRAPRPAHFKAAMQLDVRDAEGLNGWQEAGKIKIASECFAVDCVVEPDPREVALDFGTVLVHTSAERTFEIINRGKFPVRYELAVRRALRELLQIDQPKDELQPGERRTIMVTSTPNRVFEASSDGISLQIFDTLSGESVDHKIPPIRVSVTAVYNTFQVTPPRGLNFGPVEKGETQTRTFTVRNNGIFPFDWCLFDWSDPPTYGEDGRPPPPPAPVKAGPFQVKPTSGKLEPDEDVQVEVTFEAIGDEDFDSKLAIWVDGVQGDPPAYAGQTATSFQSEAMATQTLTGTSSYLLTGQSCVPGINTTDLQTVFEEQFYARTLEDAILIAGRTDVRVFAEVDQVFHFGPALVRNNAGTASQPASPTAGGPPPEVELGVTEYLRLTNPKAIPCKVQLEIKPREGGDATAGSSDVFEIEPRELVIAPHDSRQIEVKFTPTHLANFGAVLEAVVPQGTDPKSNYLSFELRGDGAVPSVSLEGPRLFGDEGGELVMGKLTLGRSHEVRMALRNDGLLPATVRVDYKPSPHFTVACPSSVALKKGERRTFQVRFHPLQVGPVQTSLNIRTLGNPYEDVAIQLMGEGYSNAICWELTDLHRPGGAFGGIGETSQESAPPAPDELELGEIAVGADLRVNFQLFNGSAKPLKFKFPAEIPAPFGQQIEVEPLEGFVEPGISQPLTLTFKPSEKLTAEKVPIACSIVSVAYPEVGSSEPPPDADGAERPYEEVPDTAHDLPLHVSAIADTPALESEVEDVNFLPTHMFCSKVYRFLIKNPSGVSVPFEWRIQGKQASAYIVAPMSGTVAAEGEKEIEVHFSPQEVENFDCTLLCSSPIIDDGKPVLRLPMTGSAIRPWCHIELPVSDYRSRRQSEVPLDPKYNIVEIVSLGTHVKNTKRFYVCNPTAEPLDFMWQREVPMFSQNRPDDGEEEPFKCLTKKGTILPSKKFEMSFEFSPQSSKTKESFWSFVLLGPKVEENFLLAGIVEEPRIGMDKPCINFGERLLQGVASETVQLVNKEHIPFSWSIDPATFQEEGELQALSISPVSGVVGPDSSVTITVSFKPLEERPFNFNVACNIKRKREPVVLNVKGIGYKIHASLAIEEPGGRRVINSGLTESLDMGLLQVHEQREVMMYLRNDSKRNFNFRVQMLMGANRRPKPIGPFEKPPYIAISKTQGVAEHHEETAIEFKYAPRDAHLLEGSILQVAIPAGPVEETFSIALSGGAKRSRVEFSFLSHDFGPCFIARDGATMAGEPLANSDDVRYERVDLIATNRDDSDCLIATNFQREPWLDVQLNAAMIPAGQSMRIPIVFSPREVCEYIQRIEFVVNDYTRMHVDVRGRGCPLKLELTEGDMQNVDFGVTKGNEVVMRQVRLVNRSPRPVTFELGDEKGDLAERAVSWSPSHPITLRPRQTADVDLKFMPMYRIAPFRLPLIAKCEHGVDVRLLHVQGTCHAIEMRLSEHSVFFGDVVVGSQATRMVRLHNFGDLGAKFRFEIPAKYAKIFSVSPSEGFVRPQEDIALTVAFNPTLEKLQDLKRADKSRRNKPSGGDALGLGMGITVKDIRCILDGHAPLQLEASGKCVSQPGETQSLEFSTEVRTKTSKSFTVTNPTETDWKLQPQVATQDPPGANFFTCDKEILVPAGKQETVEVYYLPLTMTGNDGANSPTSGRPRVALHRGTVFVGTPDGNAVCYELEGTALPPKAAARLQSRVPCKKKHTQNVPVRNWLHERQRFQVSLELVQPEPDSAQAQGINLQGVGTLDLPPGLEREYRFSIYAYHEGSAIVRVNLTSQETGEFMNIEVALEFYAAESLATIRLEAACRQLVKHKIAVANPLMQPARFTGTASESFLRFSPETLEVPPRSEKTIELLFRPLEEGEDEAEVSLKSDELGTYPYTVSWKASPAGLDKALVLKAPLGGSVVENFKFMHYAREPVTYHAKVEAAPGHKGPSIDFLLESSQINAAACTEGPQPVELPVRFQPSTLGECRGLLVISGAGGGEYKALLTGFAQPPQPQGPITIDNGKQGVVEFRNPFDKPTDFSLQVDNPAFMVPMRTQRIDPQKAVQISVNFKSEKVQGGRLIISCDKVSTPWIFFLKGLV
eukprot:TRINITY_DN12810_c0_g1_i1.p1 TRINITY_DN12810_c0_g1~~TRINITY_DN12810_c0_g1_i1.p1  ORF type:complete len:5041 (+),score=1000.88 TRINITY_DN12810_c0_g1_i1:126-15248(+)